MLSKLLLSDSVWRGIDRLIVGRISGFTGGIFELGSNVGSVNILSTSVWSAGVDGDSSVFTSDFFENKNRNILGFCLIIK